MNEIERWALERDKSIACWMVVGEDKSRPLSPSNKALQHAFTVASVKRCPLVVDNLCRLFDGATLESARNLMEYLQDTKFPVISAAHDRLVHFDPDSFRMVLADRLNTIAERDAAKKHRAKAGRRSVRAKPEARALQKEWLEKKQKIGLAQRVSSIVKAQEEGQLPMSLGDLAQELNERNILTSTGKPWTVANLRKRLKKIRSEADGGKMWQGIKL